MPFAWLIWLVGGLVAFWFGSLLGAGWLVGALVPPKASAESLVRTASAFHCIRPAARQALAEATVIVKKGKAVIPLNIAASPRQASYVIQ